MSTRILTSILAMSTYAAIVSAQAPATTQAPTPGSQATKAASVTVEGCVQRGTASNSATPGTVGTSGSPSTGFVLANAVKPTATAGATSAPPTAERPSAAAGSASIATSYRLDADDSKLSPHVGHKVEITGSVDDSSGAPAAGPNATSLPKLKVDSVKMVAATCAP